MAEVAYTRKDHGHTALVGCSNDFWVTHRAARLNDAIGACVYHHIQAITEREEGVAGHHGILQAQAGMPGLDAGNAR
ncbi:MAG: hypothetical protein RIS72_848 [Pseudomonadota bacterium]